MAEDRWEQGLAALGSQLELAPEEVLDQLRARFGERFATEAVRAAGGAWADDSPLSLRDRSLLVLAALTAQADVEPRLRSHVRWAIEHGATPEQVEAAVAFLAVYVGFPRASVAIAIVREELAALEAAS